MKMNLKRYLFVVKWAVKNIQTAYYTIEDAAIRSESARIIKEQQRIS